MKSMQLNMAASSIIQPCNIIFDSTVICFSFDFELFNYLIRAQILNKNWLMASIKLSVIRTLFLQSSTIN